MMATFTPPTYNSRPGVEEGNHPDTSLWRHYDGIPVGYSVLITGGVATTYPGTSSPTQDQIDAASSVFLGGRSYTVTAAEQTILETAGYTVA